MMELNKVMLTGNLTKDPDIRYTSQGTAVADLRLAVNRRSFDRSSGERREETMFIDVTVWEKQAEFCKNYLHKGSGIFIEGRLRQDTWEDKQGGGQRSKILVVAERIQFVESRNAQQGGGAPGGDYGEASAPAPARAPMNAPAASQPAQRAPMPAAPESRDEYTPMDTHDDLPF